LQEKYPVGLETCGFIAVVFQLRQMASYFYKKRDFAGPSPQTIIGG
jgi:hypothetical protein